MPQRKGKPFSVDTRPTKVAIVDSLTRDIGVEACVFDLIDNAIDAARDTIFRREATTSEAALPDSYDSFEIALSFDGNGFSIEDNCGGIPIDRLKTMVLRFGERSEHQLGIGIFGLGLNRALFKLGRVSHITTDTGSERAELVLNTEEYLASDDWDLPAVELRTSKKVGTSIEITQPPKDIAQTFADGDWVNKHRRHLGRRYGRFIRKGLKISVNHVAVLDGEVQIRQNGPFAEEYKFYRTDGVTIHIRFGQHVDHRFSAEPDHDKMRNAPLTEEYGWTVLCNDRAVVLSDRTWKTGWETKFHSEFYGFVGIVSFDGTDPSKLPWDTTKFDVDMNNHAYQTALVDMRKFTEKWRSYANRAKAMQRKGDKLLPLPEPTKAATPPSTPTYPAPPNDSATRTSNGSRPSGKGSANADGRSKKPTLKIDHNELRTVLPTDIDERHCYDKHLAVVHEAKQLDLNTFSYTGMALVRCLFEVSAATFFARHGKLEELQQFVITARTRKGNKIPDEKQVSPTLDELIAFMENNPSLWGAVRQNHLQHSLRKLGAHKKLLNSVMHNAYQAINRAEAFTIRDDALPVLRHLIEI
ncbi:ATP-binding protein [Bordetella bronchialis]|uniref:ATP-binding protein n=1 Tax=Bordetella bronchialis TaxID=463025 RepID=UPI003D04ECB9